MTCFAYTSDWHLGFFTDADPLPEFDRSADALLAAGDIFDGPKRDQIERFLAHTEGTPTLLITGNHDPYTSRRDKTFRVLREAFANTHVTVLANESVVMGGVRIVGTDLWSDFELLGGGDRRMEAMRRAGRAMNDYRRITFKTDEGRFRRLKPEDTLQWHIQARAFIDHELRTSPEPIALLTHHAPFPDSIPARYQGNDLSPAFASDLTALFGEAGRWPAVCIHGHIHQGVRHQLTHTTLLANPHGYQHMEVGTGFDPGATVTVTPEGGIELS